MTQRLSYREFKDELLLSIAISTSGETNKFVNPEDVASQIQDRYSPTWVMSAATELCDMGYLTGHTFLSGGGSYALLGAGLERAEEIAGEKATDLYELIDEANAVPLTDQHGNILTDEHGNSIVVQIDPWKSASLQVTQIDHLSPDFKSLDRALRDQIEILRGDNSLLAEGAEAGQRLAELEAGRILIKADQADGSLVKRVVIPALRYLLEKATDEVTKAGIRRIIDLVINLFT